MKKLICMAVCGAYLFTSTACMAFEAQCINTDGKFVDCKAEIDGGKLTVSYDSKKWQKLDKTIEGSRITSLSGGEYARRRVGESIGSAVLLGPLFLFMLFSKKKRDNFGIEYLAENGSKDAMLIQTKKKYGFAFGQQLKTISGKEIQMEGAGDTKKGKEAQSAAAEQKDVQSAEGTQVPSENVGAAQESPEVIAAQTADSTDVQPSAVVNSDQQNENDAAKDSNGVDSHAFKRKHR